MPKNNTTLFQLDSGIYPYRIFLSYGNKLEDFKVKLQEVDVDPELIAMLDDTCNGVFLSHKDYCYGIIHIPIASIPILIHELSHATFHILKRCGIKVTPSNDEVFTYLIQHLTSQIYP